MPKNYFPAACTPAIKLPDLQPPELEFLRPHALVINGITIVCHETVDCVDNAHPVMVAARQLQTGDIWNAVCKWRTQTLFRPKKGTLDGEPVCIGSVHFVSSDDSELLYFYLSRDSVPAAGGAAKSAPMNPIQKHAAASEQFFKDNPGWENVKWRPLRYAALRADIDEMLRASGDGHAEESFIEWVTASQNPSKVTAPRPSTDGAAQGGKLALLTVGRTKFDAWVMPDAGVLYVYPVTFDQVDAVVLLERKVTHQKDGANGPALTLDGGPIYAIGVDPCDPRFSPNGCNCQIRYKPVAEKNEPKTPLGAREHKLTILGETFAALSGGRHGEYVVTIRDDNTRRRAHRIIAGLEKCRTVANVDGRPFVYVGLTRSGSMREERVAFCLEPIHERLDVKPKPVEFVAKKTDAGIRREREAPLVALVNAVPTGLDPIGWRAAVLAVVESCKVSKHVPEAVWNLEKCEAHVRAFVDHGTIPEDTGYGLGVAPFVAVTAYRRAIAPHKAPTRQARSWRDVGPRLTVDIDDGRDE